ncbi:ATP-binding protein [Chloroflexota bacterium]
MEHISEILKQTRINTSRADMDTWSSAEEEAAERTDCPICKGAGIVHPLLSSGKSDYSRVVACQCTHKELGEEQQTRLQRYSNLGSLKRFSFDNLESQGRSGNPKNQERFARIYQAARAFAAEPEGWLVIGGPSGCGKTHLAAAIASERISHGQPAFYITTADLLDHLRSAFNPDSEVPYDELFDQVRNAPLLVLDDLGVQSSTPWAQEKLDQLLTYRFNSELPSVIVTITSVDKLDDRLRTRLTDSRLCHVYVVEDNQPLSGFDWDLKFALQRSMTFDNFDWRRVNLPSEQRENLEAAYRLAFDFARSPEGWLIFMGVTGCGKTHLAAAIVNYQYQAGKPALFVVVPEFLDHLRSTFKPESEISYDQLFEGIKAAPLLVLDDFGEQSTTAWAREKLYQVINYRYNARLVTVVTTRYSLQEIMDNIESSISSRLVDSKISNPFNIMAPDYRGDVRPSRRKPSRGGRGEHRG